MQRTTQWESPGVYAIVITLVISHLILGITFPHTQNKLPILVWMPVASPSLYKTYVGLRFHRETQGSAG